MYTHITAIDPSMSSTGLASLSLLDGSIHWRVETIKTKTCTDNDPMTMLGRLRGIVMEAVHFTTTAGGTPNLIVIEGPAFSRNNGMSHERAGLWWMIMSKLQETHSGIAGDLRMTVISPNLRAKYATGSGNAGKDAVMLAAAKRYPSANAANNNEMDAVVLAAMGARLLGRPIEASLPKNHLDALKTIPSLVRA
jgi:Holliday junction resolvasome RuvABC endonuclease subunit